MMFIETMQKYLFSQYTAGYVLVFTGIRTKYHRMELKNGVTRILAIVGVSAMVRVKVTVLAFLHSLV